MTNPYSPPGAPVEAVSLLADAGALVEERGRRERLIALVTLVAWSISALQAVAYFFSPIIGYYAFPTALLVLSIAGLGGFVGWLRSWRHWQPLIYGVAGAYLIVCALRYFSNVQLWLETRSTVEALWFPLYFDWYLVRDAVAKGSFLFALGIIYANWLMPLIQVAVLAAAPRPAFRHAAGPA